MSSEYSEEAIAAAAARRRARLLNSRESRMKFVSGVTASLPPVPEPVITPDSALSAQPVDASSAPDTAASQTAEPFRPSINATVATPDAVREPLEAPLTVPKKQITVFSMAIRRLAQLVVFLRVVFVVCMVGIALMEPEFSVSRAVIAYECVLGAILLLELKSKNVRHFDWLNQSLLVFAMCSSLFVCFAEFVAVFGGQSCLASGLWLPRRQYHYHFRPYTAARVVLIGTDRASVDLQLGNHSRCARELCNRCHRLCYAVIDTPCHANNRSGRFR
jgi:hypothetical protein